LPYLLGSALLIAAPLVAQNVTPLSKQGVFSALQGEWDGSAWIIMGPGPEGRHTMRQQEWVSTGAGGTVVIVKGLGTEKLPDGSVIVRHDAFATIYTGRDGKPAMRAFLANGQWIDADFAVVPDGFVWKMTNPQVGMMRYEMQLVHGKWIEKGFMSRDDGKTWNQFMEITLSKK